jgi:hypothetical protein
VTTRINLNVEDEGGKEDPGKWQGPPVDGAELLADIEQFAGRFLAFPTKHHLVVLCLWAAHTWAVSAFYVTPRLVLDSPEPGSGKTRVLEVLVLLCHDAKLTLSTTTAALYRRIKSSEDKPPTILQDECNTVFGRTNAPQAEDLRGLFNAGYKTGATVDRCEGHGRDMTVVDFPVFAPVALAGLISGPVAFARFHQRDPTVRAAMLLMGWPVRPAISAAMRGPSRSLCRGDGEEVPLAGHALELVSAAVLEFEP